MIDEITSDADLSESMEFFGRCFREIRQRMGEDPDKNPFPFKPTYEHFKSMKDMMQEHIYALEHGGQKVGYISIYEKLRDGVMIFGKMIIHPSDWDKDYKNQLFDFVLQQAKERKAGKIRVGVFEKDTWSQEWYTSQNFTQTGTMGFGIMPFDFVLFEKEI